VGSALYIYSEKYISTHVCNVCISSDVLFSVLSSVIYVYSFLFPRVYMFYMYICCEETPLFAIYICFTYDSHIINFLIDYRDQREVGIFWVVSSTVSLLLKKVIFFSHISCQQYFFVFFLHPSTAVRSYIYNFFHVL